MSGFYIHAPPQVFVVYPTHKVKFFFFSHKAEFYDSSFRSWVYRSRLEWPPPNWPILPTATVDKYYWQENTSLHGDKCITGVNTINPALIGL